MEWPGLDIQIGADTLLLDALAQTPSGTSLRSYQQTSSKWLFVKSNRRVAASSFVGLCLEPLVWCQELRHCKDNCHYSEQRIMASINVRIDDDLKIRAYRELERLGVTPSELMRQALQYVAERGQLPFKPVLLTEEDEALLATVRERLAAPQRVKVSLDDL